MSLAEWKLVKKKKKRATKEWKNKSLEITKQKDTLIWLT